MGRLGDDQASPAHPPHSAWSLPTTGDRPSPRSLSAGVRTGHDARLERWRVIAAMEAASRSQVTDMRPTRARRFAAARDRLGWVVLAVAATICAAAVIATMVVLAPLGRTFDDWVTYVHTVERMLSGSSIYAPEQLVGPYVLPSVTLIGYAYPPSSAPLFIPFVSYPIGLVAWLTLNVGLLLTGLYAILGRELGRVRPLEFAAVLFGLALLRPFYEGVAIGNASVGLAGVLAWCWVIGRGGPLIGVLAGLGASIKLVPGVLVFWSTPRTFPRVVLTALAVGLALFVLTLPLVGVQSWVDYAKALSYSEPACGVGVFPTSVACIVQPVVGVGAAKLTGIALALVAGSLAVVARSPLISFALVVFAWLAPVTDLHSHYLLVVYVLAVTACATLLGGRRRTAARSMAP